MSKTVRRRDFTVPVKQYKDIDLCFRINPVTGDIATKTNEEAIKQALKNLMLTKPGEKPFNPNIGSRIHELLFEPLDDFTADALEAEIRNNVAQFDARIQIIDIDIVTLIYDNAYSATMEFRIIGSPVAQEINFVLKRPE